MHILILASYSPSLINFRGPLIRDLISAGHRVSVAAPDISQGIRNELLALGADVSETPLQRTGQNIISDIKYLLSLKRLIHDLQPDRVLTYTIKPNIWGSFAAKLNDVPSIAMVTGLGHLFVQDMTGARLRSRIIKAAVLKLYACATHYNRRVIFQNRDDLDDFVQAGCLADPAKAVIVNGSGVCLEKYSKAPMPAQPSFLMIARLLQAKGVREYCTAAMRLKKRFPDVRAQIVGFHDEGPDAIDKQQFESWTSNGVEFLGQMDDVRTAIANTMVYVLPSYREGTPRTVLEAMAMGRPIITTDVPGCRETVSDGGNGFLVPPMDDKALEIAMTRFIEQPELAAQMGKESLRIAKEKFDAKKVNVSIMNALELS